MAKPAIAAKLPYAKTAFTPQALLAKLKMQGLIVNDEAMALKYIAYVGHFRLKGYWFQLQDPATKSFLPNTTFEHIAEAMSAIGKSAPLLWSRRKG